MNALLPTSAALRDVFCLTTNLPPVVRHLYRHLLLLLCLIGFVTKGSATVVACQDAASNASAPDDAAATSVPASDGGKSAALDVAELAAVDPANPWYPQTQFPVRLKTPQWFGESDVDAVIVLAIDDMRDPAKYEQYLRPILNRLKEIDGRAGLSIMTNEVKPDDPQLQSWLGEGVSLECHSIDHPCPLLQGEELAKARSTYERCVDLMARIPGNVPVAFRTPCCDSLNTVSPRFYREIFSQRTAEQRYLQLDSSVFTFFTSEDPELPRDLVLDADGQERFLKYLPRGNSFGGNRHDHFVNYVRNHPYPWLIGETCWQIPCLAPSDWSAQHLQGVNNPRTVEDWKAAIDLTVIKQGCFSLVFHPHGWIRAEQVLELIDHAVAKHGRRVRFLNFREVAAKLNQAYSGGQTLREQVPQVLAEVTQARREGPTALSTLESADVAALQEILNSPGEYGLPDVMRADGTHNGFFVHDRHLCWQNEDTAKRPDLLRRVPVDEVLAVYHRRRAQAAYPAVPVGAAVVDITPAFPVRLTGYGNRLKESDGVAVPIHARALTIGAPDDIRAILLTVDNCGVPLEMTERVYGRLAEKYRLPRERFALSATHSHSAPWLRGFAPNIFPDIPADHAARLAQYEQELTDRLVQVVEQALQQQRPCWLSLGYGQAGFAMNRRALTDGRWSGFGEVPDGPTDKRVPLLAARDTEGKLVAVLVNYACHCTTETGDFNQISGDWAGFTADMLEVDHPGAVALVAIGCGADANPSPRGTHEQARQHGRTLADEVNAYLKTPERLRRIDPEIVCRLSRIELPLGQIPSREEWERQATDAGVSGARARYFLGLLDAGQEIPTAIPDYPVQTWCFGEDLAMVFLGGEVVVDYSIRLNEMLDSERLWINAYSNDVPCYIASARLLREGGYEVDSSMLYYRRPTRLAPEAEDLICDAVQKQLPQHFYSAALQQDFPAPKSPVAAVNSMTARPGLRVVLAAAEPLIRDPVAFDWDERGRLWVVEMGDYPAGDDGRCGRVRILQDTDGDQVYDQATTFLDKLAWPSGIQCWKNGAIVSMAPVILYAEDTTGDDQADVQQLLYGGFVEGNQQHRVNGLRWGLDGWLYLANGDSGGLVSGLGAIPGELEQRPFTGQPVNLRGKDLRIHPETNAVQAVSGTTQFGRERDDFGHWFGNNNSNPIWQYVLDERYVARNPHAGVSGVTAAVAAVPGAAPVFPLSRTLARFNDFAFANRFTSACGTMIYRDNLLGPEFYGNALTSEPVHNLVSRLVLTSPDATAPVFQGARAEDEQQSEFLASSDNWFRPTMLRTGPDGAIWVADMYRAVIEHPEWIPAEYQRKMDLYSGSDRGRIYRVLPSAACCGTGDAGESPGGDNAKAESDLRPFFSQSWDQVALDEVAERLRSPNGWWRDTAQRILVHRRDEVLQDAELLRRIGSFVGEGRAVGVQALATLSTLGQADGEVVSELGVTAALQGLASADAEVRRLSIELLEPGLRAGRADLLQSLAALADDPHTAVRLQLLLSLGEYPGEAAGSLLGTVLLRSVDSPWMLDAGLTSLTAANIGKVMSTVLQDSRGRASEFLVSRLAGQASALGQTELLAQPLAEILRSLDAQSATAAFEAATRMLQEVGRTEAGQALVSSELLTTARQQAVSTALSVARDAIVEVDRRAAALSLADVCRIGEADRTVAEEFLTPQTPLMLQRVAVQAVVRNGGPEQARAVLLRARTLEPEVRSGLFQGVVQRPVLLPELLQVLESGALSIEELDASQRDVLLNHRDAEIADRARRLGTTASTTDRETLVADWRQKVQGVRGDATAGAVVFEKRCSTCHRLQDIGREVGADLAALKDRSTEALLTAILDPNRAVEAKFLSYTVLTTDGLQYSGMLRGETGGALTLLAGDGKEHVIPRAVVDELITSRRSLMPEGLERDLSPEDLANVMAFVQSTGSPWKAFEGNAPRAITAGEDRSLLLPAAAAEIYGPSLVFEAKYGNVGYWCSTEDYVRWSFDVPTSGDWTVEVDCACDDSAAGSLIRFSTGTRLLTARVPGTGTWDNYQTWQAGTIDLHRGKGQLIVTAPEKPGTALIDIRAIRLIPPGAR